MMQSRQALRASERLRENPGRGVLPPRGDLVDLRSVLLQQAPRSSWEITRYFLPDSSPATPR
jgi:hypothetical protein